MKLKKILSLFLCIAMVLPTVPLLWSNAQASEMEGTSAETLEKLRIPSDPISVGEEGENPYGNGAFNMYPRYELMLRDNVNHGSSSLTRVYDYDKNKSGKIWDNQNYSTSINKTYDASASTAFDWDGDGRKNHIARVTVNFSNNDGASFELDIEDDKGNLLDRTSLGITSQGALPGYELLTSLAVTSGDYDGDGKDEVTVYRPYNVKGVHSCVNVYKFTKSSSGNPRSVNWVSWDIKDLIDGTPEPNATSGFNGAAIVQLESGDLTDDLRDELIVTAGYRKSAGNNTKWMKPKSVILSCEGKETKLCIKAGFDHAWKYSDYNHDDKSGKVQVSAYGASAVGDVDGDGKTELVLAGYDINEDSLDSGSTDLNQQSTNIAVVKYDEAKHRYYLGAGGVGQSIRTHPNVADGMWDSDNHQPIALKCFNPYGTGNKDVIFVGGMVYELKEGDADASYSGVTVPSNHPAKNYGYKCLHQTGCIFPRDDDEVYYGEDDDETDNIWIGTVAAGNFMNNENGGEQIVFEHGRKRDDEGEYRHDIVSIHLDNNGNLASDYKRYNNDPATLYRRNLDLTAIDNDKDGAIMKYKSKAAYFSDPHVIAVLQAAPYFSDLEQLNSDYIEDGETLFGKSSGSGSTDTNGFSISASFITGYKNEASFLGITRLGGTDFEVEVQASMGADFEKASEVVYSTEYASDSLEDRVVLSMTPYIRYVYDLYVPEFKIPTVSEYNAKCKELAAKPDGANELKNYKEEIEKVLEKGFRYGQTVPAYTTDYIVCMPQQIRMSMVEVGVYDEMAEVNRFEKIRGNVLTETIGDPFTYPSSSNGLNSFDGGKDVVGEDAKVDTGDFIYVSKGGGTVTQSIETSMSSSKAITWGAGISTTVVNDGAGVKIGGSASVDYTGSHAWTNYSSTLCSGTVAGIPNQSVSLGYDFKWRFGQWKDTLNGEECIVLGYLTKDVKAPPYAPKNLTVKDATDTTVTLNWNHPTSRGKAYELFLVTNNIQSPYYKLATVSNDTTEYTVENLLPNTTYNFAMRSINDTAQSTYTLPVTGITRYSEDTNVPKTDKLNDIHTIAGATAFFKARVTPAEGGGSVSYQWQRMDISSNVSTWVNIPGEDSQVLEVREAKKSQDGTQYRCEVAQLVGGEVVYVYTNTATLYVGKGDSRISLAIDSPYGTASGSYQIPNQITEDQTSIEYTQKDVPGTPLNLTATVESLSKGINIIPTGVVEFEITCNGDANTILKTAALSSDSPEVNKNTASVTWTADKEGSYTIIARYKGNDTLLHSFSGQQYFEAYAIKSNALRQEKNTLVLESQDKANVGLQIELVPKIRTTTITDDGSKVTGTEVSDTPLTADKVTYRVELLYGKDASKLYTLEDNTFIPLNEGTFVITAEHQIDATTMSTSKTIYVVTTSGEQQPIYFTSPLITVFATDTKVINQLINYNASTAVSFSSTNEGVATIDEAGKVSIHGAGSTTIIAVSSVVNKQDVSTAYVLTVIKKPITITAPDLEVEYGMTTEEILNKAAENKPEISIADISLEDISDAKPYYATNFTSGSSIGRYNLNISGLVSDQYDISYISGNVTVKPKVITADDIEVKALDKEYDQTSDANITAILKEEIKYPGDHVTLEVTGSFEDENAAQTKTVSYTITGIGGSNGTNYKLEPAEITGTLSASIQPAEVKFSISVTSFVYNGEPHPIEINANCDGSMFTDFIVKYNDEEIAPAEAGSYPVTIEMSENYAGAPTDLELVISPSDQKELIIAGLPRTVEYGGEFMLKTAGGEGNGAVTWSSSDPTIAKIHEDTGEVKILRSDIEVTITATKAASANYNEQPASITFVPAKKAVTFKMYDLLQTYDGTAKYVSIKSIDQVTYDIIYTDAAGTEIDEPVNAGTYYVTVTATGNYEGKTDGILTISKAEIDTNPTLEISNGVYGKAISPAILTGNPVSTEAVITYVGSGIYTPQSSIPKNAGSYTAIAEISGENYETLTLLKNFVIEKAVITVTIESACRLYGEENPEFEPTYSGFKYSDDKSVFWEAPKVQCSAKAKSPVGAYDITASGGRADNYTFDCTAKGTLTVSPVDEATLFITGSNRNVFVGEEFTLYAYCGSIMPKVSWSSSDESIASVNENGRVNALLSGTVTITAILTDTNYHQQSAEFILNVHKRNITLIPVNTVCIFNNAEQSISLISSDSGFVPTSDNVRVAYTLTIDPSVTTAKNAGVYSCIYEINDNKYAGVGEFTFYINKAEIVMRAKDISKIYGEENPPYEIEIIKGTDIIDSTYAKSLVSFRSNAYLPGKCVKAGEYDITAKLKVDSDENYKFKMSDEKSKFIVNKAKLTVNVADVRREYGAKNLMPEITYTGFVNDETKKVLRGKLEFKYADTITAKTAIGEYEDVITANNGLTSDNYDIAYAYTDGSGADISITKIPVTASSGTAIKNHLTIKFDRAVEGLTEENFIVKNGDETVTLTRIKQSRDNETYTLYGNFSKAETYTVTINLDSTNYEMTNNPLFVKLLCKSSYSNGVGGIPSPDVLYTISFDSAGGSEISNIKVTENNMVSMPENPKKENYIFGGWFTDKKCKVEYDFDTKVTKNITLYAKWTEKVVEPEQIPAFPGNNNGKERYVEPMHTPTPKEWKNPFKDVSVHNWFYNAVKYADENKLFVGVSETEFAPDEAITRGMLVSVLYRAESAPKSSTMSKFDDVAANAYYARAVAWAEANGIVKGYSDTKFVPDNLISREEIAAIMKRYADFKGMTTNKKGELTRFADSGQITGWARSNMEWAIGYGLISGKDNDHLDSRGNVTRAEAAAILQRFFEKIR